MKLILHIGLEKTGSTTIQEFLYQNQNYLNKNKIYLSNILGKSNNRKLPAFFTDNLNDDYFVNKNIASSVEKNLHFKNFENDFQKEFEDIKNNYNYYLISSEHFHSRLTNINQIKKLKSFLSKFFSKILIIAYFRNQEDAVVSYYSTSLKNGGTYTFDEFVGKFDSNSYFFNYLEISNNWSEVFGKDNCVFRIYDNLKSNQIHLLDDFFKSLQLNINFKETDFVNTTYNKKLNKMESLFYLLINKLSVNINISSFKKDYLSHFEKLEMNNYGYFQINNSKFYDQFSQINKKFFEKYFDGKNQFKISINNFNNPSNLNQDKIIQIFYEIFLILADDFTKKININLDQKLDFAHFLFNLGLNLEKKSYGNIEHLEKLYHLAYLLKPYGPRIKKKYHELHNIKKAL